MLLAVDRAAQGRALQVLRAGSTAEIPACPRLIPHDLVVGEHLLDSRARRQAIEFVGRPGEEFAAVGDDWRTGRAVRTFRRAGGEQAHRDREDGE